MLLSRDLFIDTRVPQATRVRVVANEFRVILADVSALDISSGTATNSVNANYFPPSDWIGEIRPRSRYPYTFPYFLYPPNHRIPLAFASHHPDTSHDAFNAQHHPDGTKTHFDRIYNHTMHKFLRHNVSDLNTSDPPGGRVIPQTPAELRREFTGIGEEMDCVLITLLAIFLSHSHLS